MKRFLSLLATGALALGLSTTAQAQTRGIGAGALVLDDLHSHTVTVEAPIFGSTAWTAWQAAGFPNLNWSVPVPPANGAQSGFLYDGPLSPNTYGTGGAYNINTSTGPTGPGTPLVTPYTVPIWVNPGYQGFHNYGGAAGAWDYASTVDLGIVTEHPAIPGNVIPKSDPITPDNLVASQVQDNGTTFQINTTTPVFTVADATGNTRVYGTSELDGNVGIGQAPGANALGVTGNSVLTGTLTVNTGLTTTNAGLTNVGAFNTSGGVANINATTANLTTIGETGANNSSTTINVGTTGALTLGNIPASTTTNLFLTQDGAGKVWTNTIGNFIQGNNGVLVTYPGPGGEALAQLASINTGAGSVQFGSDRYLNTNGSTLHVTSGAGGADYATFAGASDKITLNNTPATGNTLIGNTTGGTSITGTNWSVNDASNGALSSNGNATIATSTGTTNTFGDNAATSNSIGTSATTNNFGNNAVNPSTTANNIGQSLVNGANVTNDIGNAGGGTVNNTITGTTNDINGTTNNITGATNINTTTGDATNIGLGGTGVVAIGNTTGMVGIGLNNPFSLLANTNANVVDPAGNGESGTSLTWVASTGGYAAAFDNSINAGPNDNGVEIKVRDNTLATTTALDVSSGAAPGTAGTQILGAYGNGNVVIDPSYAATTSIGNATTGTSVNITSNPSAGNGWSATGAGVLASTGSATLATNAGTANTFGNGGGATTNNIGNNAIAGTTQNTIGQNSGAGAVQNSFGVSVGTGTEFNAIGVNGGTNTVTNHVGQGNSSGPTNNTFGANVSTGTVTNDFGTSTTGPVINTFGSAFAGSSNTYIGLSSFTGNVVPTTDNTYTLGTPALRWQEAYVGPSSFHTISDATDAGYTLARDFSMGVNTTGNLTFGEAVGGADRLTLTPGGYETLALGLDAQGVGTAPGDTQPTSVRATGWNNGSWTGLGAFGGTHSTVVMGESSSVAVIGAHNANLSAWNNLYINPTGLAVRVGSLTAPVNTLDVTGTLGTSGTITDGGDLNMPATTSAAVGVINAGGSRWMFNYPNGSSTEFFGVNAGNFTMTGNNDLGVGPNVLQSLTSGSQNTGVGAYSLVNNSGGGNNTAVGYNSLNTLTSGGDNTAVGNYAGYTIGGGTENTFLGSTADANSAAAINRTAIGYGASATADNEIQLGNGSVTLVNTVGLIQTTGGATITGPVNINATTANTTAIGNGANAITIAGTTGITGATTQTGAFNLAGASSPLQVGGSAGSLNDILTSAGAGATPTWNNTVNLTTGTFQNLFVNPAGATVGITIAGTSTGNDITGNSWQVTKAGALTATNVTDGGLTLGEVTFAGTAGLLSNSANFTWGSNTLTVTGAINSTGTATIATGANLTNTFGNGGGSTQNTIGDNGVNATITQNFLGQSTLAGAGVTNNIGNFGNGTVTDNIIGIVNINTPTGGLTMPNTNIDAAPAIAGNITIGNDNGSLSNTAADGNWTFTQNPKFSSLTPNDIVYAGIGGLLSTSNNLSWNNIASTFAVLGTVNLNTSGAGATSIGNAGANVGIASTTWSITNAGAATFTSAGTGLTVSNNASIGGTLGVTGLTSTNGGLTNTGAFTTSGAAASINNNSNFATSINTGTSTGNVTIGNTGASTNSVSINVGTTGTGLTLGGLTTVAPTGYLGVIAGNEVVISSASVVSGSGTQNTIPKFTATGSTIGNSLLTDNGSVLAYSGGTINANTATSVYQINGNTVLQNSGTQNIFVGVGTPTVTVQNNNAALGYYALHSDAGAGVDGNQNTAVGAFALAANLSDYNTAVGYNSMLNTAGGPGTGVSNTAVGSSSLAGNVSGNNNTAVGASALLDATGDNNLALGFQAGYVGTAITTGTQNTLLGTNAQVNSAGAINRTAIGYNASATADNEVQLGNGSVTLVNTTGNLTTTGGATITGTTTINNSGIATTDIGNVAGFGNVTIGNTGVGAGSVSISAGSTGTIALNGAKANSFAQAYTQTGPGDVNYDFTISNSEVTANSVIVLSTEESSASNYYQAFVQSEGAGSFVVHLSAQPGAGESVKIHYVVVN